LAIWSNTGTSNYFDQIMWGAGTGATALEYNTGSFRLRNGVANGNALSPKYYRSGWTGGSRAQIRTFNIGNVSRMFGRASFGIGLAMDARGVFNYYDNPGSSSAVHPGKAVLNTAVGAWGLTGAGAPASMFYFGLEAFYPGG